MENTLRKYFSELTECYRGVGNITKSILDGCESQAKYGHNYYRHPVHKSYTEEVVDYLVTIAKLDVEVLHDNDRVNCDLLEIGW